MEGNNRGGRQPPDLKVTGSSSTTAAPYRVSASRVSLHEDITTKDWRNLLTRMNNGDERAPALEALRDMRPAIDVGALTDHYSRCSDPNIRENIRILLESDIDRLINERNTPLLVFLANASDNREVRGKITSFFTREGTPGLSCLETVLQASSRVDVCAACTDALAVRLDDYVGARRTAIIYAFARYSRDPSTRIRAVNELATLNDVSHLEQLERGARDEAVRQEAAKLLERSRH